MALLDLVRKLPYNHPYRWDGRTFGKPKLWTPSEISKAVWYDAYDLSTIVQSGGFVSQWSDKSGNNRHATQGTASKQPVTGATTIGGLNALRGVDGLQQMNISGGTAKQVFAVFNVGTDPGATGRILVLGSESASTPDKEIFVRYNADQISYDGTVGTNTGKYTLDGNSTYSTTATNHTDTALQNGDRLINIVSTDTFTLASLLGRGNSPSNNGPTNAYKWGEIIWFSSEVSQSNREKTEGYLAWKWDLVANLPAGHPYKSTPPVV